MKPARLKLTPPVTPETLLHEAVARMLDLVLLPPACWTTFPMGHVPLPAQFGQKLTRLGCARGWPDLLFVFGGRVFGIELKPDGGKLSKTRVVRTQRGAPRTLIGQADRFPQLEAAGMVIGICHSVDEVLRQLRVWGLPLRRVSVAA